MIYLIKLSEIKFQNTYIYNYIFQSKKPSVSRADREKTDAKTPAEKINERTNKYRRIELGGFFFAELNVLGVIDVVLFI